MGQRLNIIIVAEGAIDAEGKVITPDYVKDVSTFKGHMTLNFKLSSTNYMFYLFATCVGILVL